MGGERRLHTDSGARPQSTGRRPQQWLTTASDRASVGANASALFLRSQHHHEDLTSAHSGNLHIRAMKRRHHHSHFTGDQSETQRGSRAPSSPTQDTFSLGLLGPFLSCYFSCSCRTQLHQLGLHTAIQLDKAASGFKALSDFRAVWHQEGPRQGPHPQGIYNPATKMTLDIDSNQIHSGMPHVLRKGKDHLLLRMDLK